MPTLIDLARACLQATGPSRRIDGEIFKRLHSYDDDVWHQFEGGVWYRRDREDAAAFDAPPPFTASFDYALQQKLPTVTVASLTETADGRWRIRLDCPVAEFSPEVEAVNPALAFWGAQLQIHALLNGEIDRSYQHAG